MPAPQTEIRNAMISVVSKLNPAILVEPVHSDLSLRYGCPVVFGSSARPLVGRLHETAGPAVGTVVLCAPWGYEENCAFVTFQTLAMRLAERGFEVLRFDYDGCGNSFGDSTDTERVASWISSVVEAITFMATRSDHPVRIVGLRMGAALAVLASARASIDRVVLWDPVVSGRRYLRVLRAMSMMGVDAAPDPGDPGSLVTIGHSLNSATVREIELLNLQSLGKCHIAEALVVSRPGASDPGRLAASLQALGVPATVEQHVGTEKLLDCAAEQSVIPFAILERIVGYITERPGLPAVRNAPLPSTAVLVAPIADGWTEEHYTVGPRGLAAVLTLPRRLKRAGVVVMSNNGVARSIGPARAWVEWARNWAALGIASLRLDLSGLGDSGIWPPQASINNYPIEAIDDFAAAIEDLRRRGLGPAIAVGLCSGAFLSLDAVAAKVNLAGVVAINSQLFYLPDPPDSANRARRAAPPTHPRVQRFLENTRIGRRLARMMPFPVWWALDRLGLQPSPFRGVDAARPLAPVLLIYGDENLGLLRLKQRDPGGLRRWQNDGGLVIMQGLDHSMFAPQIRRQVEARALPFLLEHLPAAAVRSI